MSGPLSRPLRLHRVTPEGVMAEVEATEAERAALAAELGLPAIHALSGRFRIAGTPRRVAVTGRVEARVEQTCVVTLEPFEADVSEAVEAAFETPRPDRDAPSATGAEVEADLDRAEDLVGDTLDLGAITAEFLALALDPHPRKPGASFAQPDEVAGMDGPFASLAALRQDRETKG